MSCGITSRTLNASDERRVKRVPTCDAIPLPPRQSLLPWQIAITNEPTSHSQSLVEYTQATSWLRVFCVCSSALSPPFALAILIEFLPLRSPSEGWRSNWNFWIRLYLSNIVISFGAAIQLALTTPGSGLTLKHALVMAMGVAFGFVLHTLMLAQTWRFPVPFSLAIGTPAWYVFMYLSAFLAIGWKKWRDNPAILMQIKAAFPLCSAQVILVMIYPVFNAIFLQFHDYAQVAFLLLLPIIKYFMNRLIVRVSTGIPAGNAIGMVSAKLFDAMYMFKCMGSAGSLVSGAVLLTLDLLQNMYHLWKLHQRVRTMNHELVESVGSGDHKTLIHKSMSKVPSRTHSILCVGPMDQFDLTKNSVGPDLTFRTRVHPAVAMPRINSLSVLPGMPNNRGNITRLDENVRKILHESERIVLIEFIECVVPTFYAVYLFVLFHLPNAKYYPETANLEADKLTRMLRNIAAYATLEFGSLLYVHVFLRWKLNISALHMVANVLERDTTVLQAVFMSYIIVVLQWTLEHTGISEFDIDIGRLNSNSALNVPIGVDYSLKFHWS